MDKEVFKDIPNYEGMYKVSNLGRVKSFYNGGRILKPTKGSNGYLTVTLMNKGCRSTKTVHQLVAIIFLKHIPNGHQLVVNHINFNKLDNRLGNLEVVTHRENSNQKHIKSTSKYVGVHWRKDVNKWRALIGVNGKDKCLGHFKSEYKAHLAYQKALAGIKNNQN